MVSEIGKTERYLKESNSDKLQTENHNIYTYALDNFYTNLFMFYLIRFLFQICLVNRCKQTH